MKNNNAVSCVFAHIAPDLKEGSKNIICEKKKSLFRSVFKNFSFSIRKNMNGVIREIRVNKSLTVSLLSTSKLKKYKI